MQISLLFYIINILIVRYFSRKYTGLIIILIWWGILNFLHYFSLSGLFLITTQTQYIYFLFFTLFTFSFLVTERLFNFRFLTGSNITVSHYYYNTLFYLALIFLIPIQAIFTIRGIYLLSFVMNPSYYRSDVFGLITGTSSLFFNSIQVAKAHSFIIGPLQFVIFFSGISYTIFRKKVGLFVLGIILLVLDAFMMFGRFGYHYLIISLCLYFLFSKKFRKVQSNFKYALVKVSALLFILLITVFAITKKRGDSGNLRFFETYLITYHTESFTIFDIELKNPNSILHEYTYGLSTLGGIERYFIPLINIFGYRFISQADQVGGYLHQNFLIGYDEYNNPLLFNAYGSIFFTMYRDGGLIAVSVFGILLGFFFSIYSGSLKTKDPIDFAIFYGLLFLILYGIFQPTVLGPMLPALFILYILKQVLKAYTKLIH
ncbi:oligosaccharide repeat unit polymerase [Leptospira levettii]|uniref:O-antigen polymerase n=1 Tax=Leptospira levettii TaxID=2023178 RepID=UPI00223DD18B|nr:O-antigen polymerase [Leptospira levettii]MCW7497048.1 oligosaccharide repeat unit polymerase [Leptospira levettii]